MYIHTCYNKSHTLGQQFEVGYTSFVCGPWDILTTFKVCLFPYASSALFLGFRPLSLCFIC